MTTHLTKIWWDLNKHKLVEQAIPEAEIYKREWIGLTDEQIRELADKHLFYQPEGYEVSGVFALARAVEAKHKEKNGG
jgi:hypothetical protein